MAQEETAVIPYALNIIGLVYNARGDFTHAETCFLTILKDEASDPEVTARAWRGLGEMYKGQGQDSPAQEAFQKAIELFTQIDMPKEVEKTRASAA
jgi:Tfp pilus assembly protein PilF